MLSRNQMQLYNHLPPDIANLPTIECQPWLKICDKSMCLEGPVFDTSGNLYVCQAEPFPKPLSRILKISPERTVSLFCDLCNYGMCLGLAWGPDGKLFGAAMGGGILVMDTNGNLLRQIDTTYPNGDKAIPNDCIVDSRGDLWFTDYRGYVGNACGNLVRMRASENYCHMEKVVSGLCCPNGLALSPDESVLWLAESNRNAILQIHLQPDGELSKMGEIVNYVYYNTGMPMPDGCTIDERGFLYQAVMRGGRVLVLDEEGVPVGNLLTPGRKEKMYNNTSNLTKKPNTKQMYITCSGNAGSWVLCCDYSDASWA